MSKPMSPDDPAYWMLERGLADSSARSTPTVHKKGCYICEDPEFALMGLPLCRPCPMCGGHVAADDSVCDTCGKDFDEFLEHMHAEGVDEITCLWCAAAPLPATPAEFAAAAALPDDELHDELLSAAAEMGFEVADLTKED